MRLPIVLLCLVLVPTLAFAVVMPEEEWFDSPANQALWQQMWPVLNEWEFGERDLLLGPRHESLAGIEQHLGLDNEEVAAELGVEPDSPEILRYDLNLDGRVDQFDLLELGYEVIPPQKTASIAPSFGMNEWIVLRADFSDADADYETYDIDYFEARLFDEGAPKPSCHDYFNEVSYGNLSITGSVPDIGDGGDGWYKGEHTKQWYISNSGAYLVYEAVLAADEEGVDFSEYDVDGDGYVDTCILFYPDQVFSGGLWPHRSSGLNIHVDGVIVDSYFLTGYDKSNDSKTMVISCHEYGHILGLPDFYDIDYSSAGIGRWGLMANNYDTAQKPPSPCPWSKIALGWVMPTVVTDDTTSYSLGCFQDEPKVLKVWTNGKQGQQYFLVANYRKKKTDVNRPGQGLLVLHVDDDWESQYSGDRHNWNNKNENHKHVDVESARGYGDPGAGNPQDPLDDGSSGHANDVWFDGNDDADYTGIFDDDSNPFARDYPNPGEDTYIKLSNISASADSMTLDIQVETADAPACDITSPSGGSVSGNVAVDVTATPTGTRTIDHVEFYCNNAYLGEDTSSPYSLTFDSRKIYDGDRVIVAIAVDDEGDIDTDNVTVTIGNSGASLSWSDGFESGLGAWAVYDPMGDERWESKSIASAGSNSAGIGTASGYDFDEHDSLVSIKFNLAGATHPIARWRQRYCVAGGENTCKVFITDDDGDTLDLLQTYTGKNLSWHPAAVDLADYVGEEVHLVFKLDSSSLYRMGTEAGWWIDVFEVHEISSPPSVLTITPGDGSTLTGVETITVTASDDEAVLAVDFLINGDDLIYIDYSSPFTYDWNSDWVFNGSHTFTAKAYDADLQNDSLTVNWTTSNAGESVPWSENYDADPGTAWRIIDENGAGEWHFLGSAGYSGGGMRMCIKGGSTHDNNDSDWFISPTLAIGSTNDPGVGYLHKYDIEKNYDYGRVYVTTDLDTWTQLAVYSLTNQPWQAAGHRLDDYAGTMIKLSWYFESDGGLVEGGWWVDEARVQSAPQITDVQPDDVENGDTITISGSGFGSAPANDFPTVLVAGYSASYSAWSDTEITATVPSQSPSGDVKVVRHGIESDGFAITVRLKPPGLDPLEQL